MNFRKAFLRIVNLRWWSDLKIGFKIGIGISVLTALAATIGLIAIMGMGIIKKESNALSKESLPGLNSAYRADKTWRETMFYLKSYDYTSSPFYYRWGKKSLDKFKNSLGILEKLSNESSVNKKNSEKLDEIKVQLNEFETVLDDGYKLESKNEYYISDLKKYSLKLQAISGGNLSIYAKCMTLSNNIIHAINSRTPKELLLAQQYASSFESEVRQIKDNSEFGETAFNLFETAKKLIPSYIAARTLELKRHEISNIMKEGIRELSDVGVNQINEMSEITNGIIVKSRSTLFIILIGILFLGVVFGVIITYSITSALKRGVDLAVNISNGELHDQEEVDRKDEIGELMNALNRMNNQLKFIVEDITTGFKNILIASNEINRNATELSEAAIDQAATTEEISSSIEELHANFLQNAENANTTEEIAMAAVEGIRDGNKATEMASKSLDAIIERIGFIGDLAFQTNILALNAAVEAARAGDHGRGFAVVAGEVKRLADSSKEAAEIINKVSRETMVASDQAGDKLRKIVPEIEKTAQLIQGIKLASNEQEVGINQINNAIQQLNNIAQLNAESSEKLSFSSIKLADLSNKFQKTISFFKVVKSGKK